MLIELRHMQDEAIDLDTLSFNTHVIQLPLVVQHAASKSFSICSSDEDVSLRLSHLCTP